MEGIIFLALIIIAGAIWRLVAKVQGSPETSGWKCPQCGLYNNLEGSSYCLCGYSKNRPTLNELNSKPAFCSSKGFEEPPATSKDIGTARNDFESLTRSAFESAIFEKNYSVLGLPPTSTFAEVQERCKQLIKKWHPDLHKDDPGKHEEATKTYEAIKAAFEAIADKKYPSPVPGNAGFDTADSISKLRASAPPLRKYATAWPRFFARIFDIWWESILIGFFIGAVLGATNPSFTDWLKSPGSSYAFSIILLPVVLLFDAIVFSAVGNTPGKMLLGLKVKSRGNLSLEFGEYLARNFAIWIKGLGFGIPIVNLITMARQHARIKRGEAASYDGRKYKLHVQDVEGLQICVFVILFTCLLIIQGIMQTMK